LVKADTTAFKTIMPDRNCNFIFTGLFLITSKGYLDKFPGEELLSSNAPFIGQLRFTLAA